jgi:hypothetical protein
MKKIFMIGLVTVICAIVCIAVEQKVNAVVCAGYSITIDPSGPLDFGSQPVLTTSVEQPVLVTNSSSCTADLTDFTIEIQGTYAKDFKIVSDDCGDTLAWNASCTANVVFSPKAIGVFDTGTTFTATGAYAVGSTVSTNLELAGTGTEPEPGTVAMLTQLGSKDNSDGCNATASTGVAGKRSSGPAALGLVALMGLVLGAVTVRRRMRKRS